MPWLTFWHGEFYLKCLLISFRRFESLLEAPDLPKPPQYARCVEKATLFWQLTHWGNVCTRVMRFIVVKECLWTKPRLSIYIRRAEHLNGNLGKDVTWSWGKTENIIRSSKFGGGARHPSLSSRLSCSHFHQHRAARSTCRLRTLSVYTAERLGLYNMSRTFGTVLKWPNYGHDFEFISHGPAPLLPKEPEWASRSGGGKPGMSFNSKHFLCLLRQENLSYGMLWDFFVPLDVFQNFWVINSHVSVSPWSAHCPVTI